MIEYIFLDLDDTILDFHWAENQAITQTMTAFGIDPSEENKELYRKINLDHWKRMEQGELTMEQLKTGRFATLLQSLDMTGDPDAMAETYWQWLGRGHCFLPGAEETVKTLAKNYRLFLATNGNPPVQYSRLESADLSQYFEKIFISYEIGYRKPQKEFFDHCFDQISGFDKSRAIMIGDSLSSDIQGGINAGILTCWVNPDHREPHLDILPDCQIETLSQLLPILAAL